jgi:hypothetical protein
MRSFNLEKRKRLFADAFNVAMCHSVSEYEEDEEEDRDNELRRIKENVRKFGRSCGDWLPWIKLPEWIYNRRYARTFGDGS